MATDQDREKSVQGYNLFKYQHRYLRVKAAEKTAATGETVTPQDLLRDILDNVIEGEQSPTKGKKTQNAVGETIAA